MNAARMIVPLALAAALTQVPVRAAGPSLQDLVDLSLEQLAAIEVTSVSRRAQPLSEAAASIFVITADDIRRSGATSLPEALRLAPNLQVARNSASGYAISARGFNNAIGNKLLVLIDGRTVYTPLFSGVFWDAQDVMLEDVERIEVISGPGATLWGANAVNGVINVITRPAADTQGSLLALGGGNLERGGAARHGGKIGDQGHFRLYGRVFERDNTRRADGTPVRDAWDRAQTGFRADWGDARERFTLQGDAYHGDLEQSQPRNIRINGFNLLGRWNRQLRDGSGLRLQAYFDHTERDQPGTFREELDVVDIELQHALPATGAHRLMWGGGYRHARDRVDNSAALAFLPADRDLDWANLFLQDEIELRRDLTLTAGLKMEHNTYTGVEWLPGVRVAWRAAENRLLWGAISRAVRAPSRIDREFFIPGSAPFLLNGGPGFRSEISNVVEIGYRAQPSPAVSYSLTAFHHRHDRLRSIEPAPGGGLVLDNRIDGTTSGAEAWGSYRVNASWRLMGGVMLLDQRLRRKPESGDVTGVSALGNDPHHQWLLRSTFDLTPRHEFDLLIRRVGALPEPRVPAYTAVDVRLGWRARRDLELSATLQNLLDESHPEFGAAATRSEYRRGMFLKLLWRP